MRNLKCSALLAGSLLLAACGGGGDGGRNAGGASAAAASAKFEGIWSGTSVSSINGNRTDVVVASLPTGETWLYALKDCYVAPGTSTAANGNLTFKATAYSRDFCYGDRETIRGGWIPSSTRSPTTTVLSTTGNYSAQTAHLTYSMDIGSQGSASLQYWNLYDRSSSLAKIAGQYSNRSTLSITIDANGKISG